MPGGFGDATGMRRRANIAAALGEFERAAVLLRQAWAGGWDWTLYHQTPTYELLRASPGFQALIKPRG